MNTTTGTPLLQHMDALLYVRICVGKVYTNGLICVAVGGVVRVYNDIYTSIGKQCQEALQDSNIWN